MSVTLMIVQRRSFAEAPDGSVGGAGGGTMGRFTSGVEGADRNADGSGAGADARGGETGLGGVAGCIADGARGGSTVAADGGITGVGGVWTITGELLARDVGGVGDVGDGCVAAGGAPAERIGGSVLKKERAGDGGGGGTAAGVAGAAGGVDGLPALPGRGDSSSDASGFSSSGMSRTFPHSREHDHLS